MAALRPDYRAIARRARPPATRLGTARSKLPLHLDSPTRLARGETSLWTFSLRSSRIVAEPGRNTPCPCGSGLKYKRCCAQGFTDEDVERGLEALVRLVGSWHGVDDIPWEAFYGPQGRPPGPKSIEDDVYLDWLYFDVRNNRGLRLVDLLLRTKELPRGIRAYAAAMGRLHRAYPGDGSCVALPPEQLTMVIRRKVVKEVRGTVMVRPALAGAGSATHS